MSAVFADTFYFLALVNPRDQAHARAVAHTVSFQGRMVTTAWVLTEFADAMADPRNRPEFLSTLADLLSHPQVVITPPTLPYLTTAFSYTPPGTTSTGRSPIAFPLWSCSARGSPKP